MNMADGMNMREFLSIDALMAEYILENPNRFAEWLNRQDKMVKPSLRTRSLSTDETALVLATQTAMARRMMAASASMFGGL
jgi:hypothetical protein